MTKAEAIRQALKQAADPSANDREANRKIRVVATAIVRRSDPEATEVSQSEVCTFRRRIKELYGGEVTVQKIARFEIEQVPKYGNAYKKARPSANGTKPHSINPVIEDTIEQLKAAREFAARVGGIDQALGLLRALQGVQL